MRRAFYVLSALTLALATAGPAAAQAQPAVSGYAPPSAAERRETLREFEGDAARTLSERAGDLFMLPRKYNFISGVPTDRKTMAHVRVNGRVIELQQGGIAHGVPWSYDREIPLVLWGPSFVPAGRVVQRRTSQQDLVPTVARLIGAPKPAHARGRVLEEGLLPVGRRPKVVLTVVFDQGGEQLLRLHPQATPFINRLKREGTTFANTRVSHLDQETGMGHVAIGTGAFPRDHGLPSNDFFHAGAGRGLYGFWGPDNAPAPFFLMSPSLADVWLKATQNRALVMSYSYADRAAMGMAGHGSFYQGNQKPWVYFLDVNKGALTTNERYYALPAAARGESLEAFAARALGEKREWMGHPIQKVKDLLATPILPRWEGEHLTRMIDSTPFGADDVPDLVYIGLKSTDATGHTYGQESEEAGAVLAEQDRQFERLVRAMERKVGRENLVVAFSADHGGTPLPELTGGKRLYEQRLLDDLNARFDKADDGFPLATYVTATQLWVDRSQMEASQVTLEDLKAYLQTYQVEGQPFFEAIYTRDEIGSLRRLDLAPGL